MGGESEWSEGCDGPSHYIIDPSSFKRWRQFALVKQGALAETLGVCQSLVSRYEQAHLPMQAEKLQVAVKEINDALRRGGVHAHCCIQDLVTEEIWK